MDIIQMALQVRLVTNHVIPKTPLPESRASRLVPGLLVRFGKVGLERAHNLAKLLSPTGLMSR